MRMIPSIPHFTHSQAEKRVFDLLSRVFENEADDVTAYHSMNLTRHAYKRFGEIDFLLCGKCGIYVLEIKGGGVTCAQGLWTFSNRYGEAVSSAEGPFRQAESALHGLLANLRENLPQDMISQFCVGYGVLFPDCRWDVRSAEWDSRIILDNRGIHDLERWLKTLICYWQEKRKGQGLMTTESLAAVKNFLRPSFEAAVPLHIQTRRVAEQIVRLTDDQMRMLDVVEDNPRVCCYGGAGTGKTMLALELAKRWASEGARVALVCRSPWLKRYLEAQCFVPGLSVTTDSALAVSARRIGVEAFDSIIVDEGQDVLNWEGIWNLGSYIKGGILGGRWCFFYDINNQTGLFGEVDPQAIEFLNTIKPVRVPLRRNCRNTKVILDEVKERLNADMGVVGAGDGPKVREQLVVSDADSARIISQEIQTIIDDGGLTLGELTILSPLPFCRSSVSLIGEEMLSRIITLDQYYIRSFPPEKISFAEIPAFKGLENEAILVVDLVNPDGRKGPHPLHYIAMSRARALLSLVFREPSC